MIKSALLSLFAASAFAASWTGVISDAGCGAKHADSSEASIKCVERCVARTGAAVLVVGDTVMKISADSKDKIKPHLGHKVTVTGKLDGETVSVDTIEMAK